jgi:uncharacterized membrane protein
MADARENLTRYAETGALSAPAYQEALRLAGVAPDSAAWRVFLDRLLVVSGVLLVAVGLIFFVAFNWQELGRFAKFGLLEAMVLLPTAYALVAGISTVRAQAALLFAVLALGGLLALTGQTYQTGADNYELFLAWALLSLPWVLAGRWAPLWAVWWTLVNVAVALYLFEVLDPLRLVLFGRMRTGLMILVNLAGLALFEWAYTRAAGLRTRWLARYCVLLALGAGSMAALMFILDGARDENGFSVALYFLMMMAGAVFYQFARRDLFPLAFGVLSLIVVITAWLGKLMLHGSNWFGSLFLIAFFIIGASIGATWWLRELNRSWHSGAGDAGAGGTPAVDAEAKGGPA